MEPVIEGLPREGSAARTNFFGCCGGGDGVRFSAVRPTSARSASGPKFAVVAWGESEEKGRSA